LIRTPDLDLYSKWFSSGSVELYPFITEFIARIKTNNSVNETKPLYIQQMGYSPLST
jgi:hypothetical protein